MEVLDGASATVRGGGQLSDTSVVSIQGKPSTKSMLAPKTSFSIQPGAEAAGEIYLGHFAYLNLNGELTLKGKIYVSGQNARVDVDGLVSGVIVVRPREAGVHARQGSEVSINPKGSLAPTGRIEIVDDSVDETFPPEAAPLALGEAYYYYRLMVSGSLMEGSSVIVRGRRTIAGLTHVGKAGGKIEVSAGAQLMVDGTLNPLVF
jgi:hypothetical protein